MTTLKSNISQGMTIGTGLFNLILVKPQRNNQYNPQLESGGLGEAMLFHYEGENNSTLESDITDHYTEENSSVNDHIGLRPETITVQGYIGELNDVIPFVERILNNLKDKLLIISTLTPQLSITALDAFNTAFQGYQLVKSAIRSIESWKTIKNSGVGVISSNGLIGGEVSTAQNKQQVAYQQFYAMWRKRTLFTVQTPWAVFNNMAIKSFRASQDAETNMITGFEITFKMVRFAAISRPDGPDPDKAQGRLKNQLRSVTNSASSKGAATSTTVAGMTR